MSDKVRDYSGDAVSITYDATRCIHAAECIRGLPAVFDTKRRQWIDPSAAGAAAITEVVMRCPTGALHATRRDGGPDEPTPARNVVTVSSNGPLYVRGELEIETSAGTIHETRAALCRCGASKRRPFCDGSHQDIGFRDDGQLELGKPIAPPQTDRDGPLLVRASHRGPLLFGGVLEIRSGDERTWARLQHPALCRCGHSRRKPFCDATHQQIGFDG